MARPYVDDGNPYAPPPPGDWGMPPIECADETFSAVDRVRKRIVILLCLLSFLLGLGILSVAVARIGLGLSGITAATAYLFLQEMVALFLLVDAYRILRLMGYSKAGAAVIVPMALCPLWNIEFAVGLIGEVKRFLLDKRKEIKEASTSW